jgi:uncharacterized protein
MPKRDVAPVGHPCWIDLMTSDPDRSREFYDSLFGWTSEDAGEEYGGYINFTLDGLPVAGCMKKTPEMGDHPDVWSIYLAVDDAQATTEAATANGGQVVVPAMDVMALGRMAVIIDGGGASIGLWQPGEHKGFGILAEPNTPSWFELFTRDYDDAVEFYRKVFGWNTHTAGDSEDFRYTTLEADEKAAAGIMDASGFLPEGVPAHWSVYFGVDDTDKALAQIADLGGSTVQGPDDTPYGRLATALDPTGAQFKLLG